MCIFCDIANKKLETNIVYEDETVMVFLDNDPINEGHVLLIPKEHYLDVTLWYFMILLKKCYHIVFWGCEQFSDSI